MRIHLRFALFFHFPFARALRRARTPAVLTLQTVIKQLRRSQSRTQGERIDEPCDHIGVGLVAFASAGENGAKLAGVGHEHFVSQLLKESASPGTVASPSMAMRDLGYFVESLRSESR